MQNKQVEEKEATDSNLDENADQETVTKITLKNQKPVNQNAEDVDDNWKKVESVIGAAKEVYQSGKASFGDIVETMIATLQDLLASETDGSAMGGLYSGPQMNIPAEPDSNQEVQ